MNTQNIISISHSFENTENYNTEHDICEYIKYHIDDIYCDLKCGNCADIVIKNLVFVKKWFRKNRITAANTSLDMFWAAHIESDIKKKFIRDYVYYYVTKKLNEWICDEANYECIPYYNLKKIIDILFIKNPKKYMKNHNVMFRSIFNKECIWYGLGYDEKEDFKKDFNEIINNSKYKYFNKY